MNYKSNSAKTLYTVLLTLLLILFISCSKNTDKNTRTENVPADTSGETAFQESNEDFLKVDFNYFYNELSPHGEWIEVSAKDLGIDIKPGTSNNSDNGLGELYSDIIGIKTAYAQTDSEILNLFVWRPAVELASTMINESTSKEYVPYNNGQWVYTDAGWYFKAATPQEDLTSHYGRWTQDPNLGWVWLPGRVWAPSWVDWRENDDYVAWAPVPPGAYIDKNAISQTIINENRYTIVEKKQFMEPSVYKYRYQYVENKNKIMIKEMTKQDGIMIKNKTVINKGPDPSGIEKITGKKINQVKINKVGKKEDISSTSETISVFTPQFKKVQEMRKEPVSKPEKRVAYKDAKKITKDEKEELKQEEKDRKADEKEMKKEDKEIKKEQKEHEKDVKKEGKKDKDDDDKIKGDKDKEQKDKEKKDKQDKGKK